MILAQWDKFGPLCQLCLSGLAIFTPSIARFTLREEEANPFGQKYNSSQATEGTNRREALGKVIEQLKDVPQWPHS